MAFPYHSSQFGNNPFNNPTNDDDEFGEFTSAVTFAPAVTANQTGCSGLNSTHHNFFVNHTASPVTSANPHNSVPINALDIGHKVVTTNQVFFNPIPDSDDEFGDFCGPVEILPDTSSEVSARAKAASPDLLFINECEAPANFQPNYHIDLDGDLAFQLPWTPVEVVTQNREPEAEEDFGDFAAAEPEATVTATSKPPLEESLNQSEILPDDSVMSAGALDLSIILPSPLVNETSVLSVPVSAPAEELFDDRGTDDEFGEFTQATSAVLSSSLLERPSEGVPATISEQVAPVQQVTDLFCLDEEEIWQESDGNHFISMNEGSILEPIEMLEDPLEIAATPEESPEEEAKDNDDEFGDFATFQSVEAAEKKEDAEEEEEPSWEEFDDFETAPPVQCAAEGQPSAEARIQQLLAAVFPYPEADESARGNVPVAALLTLCSTARGALWSYVKEMDSTPALSFQWRNSGAHHRFLTALRIDSHSVNPVNLGRWNGPTSPPTTLPITPGAVNTSINSGLNDSGLFQAGSEAPMSANSVATPSAPAAGGVVPVTLDLDFFLNQSSSSSVSLHSVSLLETIEKELLAVENSSPTVSTTSTSASLAVDGVFDQLASLSLQSPNGNSVDLLK